MSYLPFLSNVQNEVQNWSNYQDIDALNRFGANFDCNDYGYVMSSGDTVKKRAYLQLAAFYLIEEVLINKNIQLAYSKMDPAAPEETPRFQFPTFEDAIANKTIQLPQGSSFDLDALKAIYESIVNNVKQFNNIKKDIKKEITEGKKEQQELLTLEQKHQQLLTQIKQAKNSLAVHIPTFSPYYEPEFTPSQISYPYPVAGTTEAEKVEALTEKAIDEANAPAQPAPKFIPDPEIVDRKFRPDSTEKSYSELKPGKKKARNVEEENAEIVEKIKQAKKSLEARSTRINGLAIQFEGISVLILSQTKQIPLSASFVGRFQLAILMPNIHEHLNAMKAEIAEFKNSSIKSF